MIASDAITQFAGNCFGVAAADCVAAGAATGRARRPHAPRALTHAGRRCAIVQRRSL